MPSDLTTRVRSGLLWAFSGETALAVLRLATLAVLARLLVPEDFGVVAAALAIVDLAKNFAQIGVGQAIIQHPKLEHRHLATGVTVSLTLTTSMMLLSWLLAPTVGAFFKSAGVVPILRAVSITFPIRGIAIVAQALLQREMKFKSLVSIDILSYGAAYGLVGIPLAVGGAGAWSLAVAYVLYAAMFAGLTLYWGTRILTPGLNVGALKELLTFGGGITLSRFAGFFAQQGDNLVVGRWLGVQALGIYSRAYGITSAAVTLVGTVLDNVLFPAMARIQHDQARLEIGYRRAQTLASLLMLPASAVLWIIAPELIAVLLGPGWTEAIVPFQVLSAGLLFRAGSRVALSVARGSGVVYSVAWRWAVYAVLVVLGAYLGQTAWGLKGVALGVLAATAVNYTLIGQLALTLTTLRWKDWLVMHVPGAVLVVVVMAQGIIVASWLRSADAPPLLRMVVLLLTSGAASVLMLRYALLPVLGGDLAWMFNLLLASLPRRIPFGWALRKIPMVKR